MQLSTHNQIRLGTDPVNDEAELDIIVWEALVKALSERNSTL